MSESNGQKNGRGIGEKKRKDSEELENEKEIKRPDPEDENYVISPPNGGWGWVVVLSAFYINAVADGIQLTFGIFLKPITEEFDAKYSEVALAGSLIFGIHLLMGPICAGCNKVFGLRPVTITGSLLCCFGVGISYFSTGYWILYISFGIIGGIGLGLVYMNSLVITSLYFTSFLPLAMAIVVCGSGVGTVIFAVLGNFLLKKTSWKNSFLLEAALAGSMSIAAIIFKPLKPIKVKISPADSLLRGHDNKEMGETSSVKKSVFIKTEMSQRLSLCSIATLQSIAWNFAENMIASDLKEKKKERQWCKCCKKCKKKSEPKNFLVLQELKSQDRHGKSFVEEAGKSTEKEISSMEKQRSSVYYKVIYRTETEEKSHKIKFTKKLKTAIISVVDCKLLKSCSFFLFTISGALQVASFLVVFTYEKDRIENLGFTEDMSIYFIVALGGANVFWRLFLGCFALIPKVNYRALSISTIVIGGIATMSSCYFTDIYFQFAFCTLFGLGMAGFAVFRMVLLVDLVGVDLVATATGINLLFMGIFSIVFPPVFGCIMGTTKYDYNLIFGITGGLTVISGLMLIGLKKIKTKENIKRNSVTNS